MVKKWKPAMFLAAALTALAVSWCSAQQPGGADKKVKAPEAPPKLDPRIKDHLDLHQRTEIQEYDLLRRPTAPVKIKRLLPEWETARYLLLAVPAAGFGNEAITQSFVEVIRHSLDVTDVLLLVNEEDSLALRRLFQVLEQNKLQERVFSAFSHENGKKQRQGLIHILPIRVDSFWVRDYGPVFALSEKDKLCMLDSIYRDARTEISAPSLFIGPAKSNKRLKDDQVPTVMAPLLGTRHLDGPITVVRPPLQLWGGDLFTDGEGNGFTSSNTIVMNGGDEGLVSLLLKEYYGLKHVVYLEPLPMTIKHVDMFFRPVDKSTFLLAEYPTDVPASEMVHEFLHKDIHATLERNAKILRREFPAARIIRVPMPALQSRGDRIAMVQSSTKALGSVKLDPADWLLQGHPSGTPAPNTFEELTIDFALKLAGPRPGQSRSAQMRDLVARGSGQAMNKLVDVERKILALQQQLKTFPGDAIGPLFNLMTPDEKTRYSQVEKDLQAQNTLKATITAGLKLDGKYRTYLNAVHLKGRTREKVLVPSYQRHRDQETLVRQRFQEAYPDAEIVFIPSDQLSEGEGALHCMTCVIPDVPAGGTKK